MSREINQHDLALWVIRLSSDQHEELQQAQTEFAQWQGLHHQEAQLVQRMMQFSEEIQQDSTRYFFDAQTLQQSLSEHHHAALLVDKYDDSHI